MDNSEKFIIDMRCMQLTIQKNIACSKAVEMNHVNKCECQYPKNKIEKVIQVLGRPNYCPCGLPRHEGECRDAARVAKGLKPIKWKP